MEWNCEAISPKLDRWAFGPGHLDRRWVPTPAGDHSSREDAGTRLATRAVFARVAVAKGAGARSARRMLLKPEGPPLSKPFRAFICSAR